MKNMDTRKLIAESTDIEYLTELDRYVDMDIESLGRDSNVIKAMKAKMRNITVDEMDRQNLEYFNDLKERIRNRLIALS